MADLSTRSNSGPSVLTEQRIAEIRKHAAEAPPPGVRPLAPRDDSSLKAEAPPIEKAVFWLRYIAIMLTIIVGYGVLREILGTALFFGARSRY